MANLFPQWTNQLPWKLAIVLVVLLGAVTAGLTYYFTPKYTRVGYEPDQPVPFSHALHVGQLKMDCRFCHGFVEVSPHANLPTAQTCMSCHQQIKPDSPRLAAVRAAWNGGRGDGPPIRWVRVHQLPDYVYFDHSAHVNRGVSCYTCHGSVGEMDLVSQREPMSMSWCLDCHRAPENHLRPLDHVFDPEWKPASPLEQRQIGLEFKKEWEVHPPVTCGGCHR